MSPFKLLSRLLVIGISIPLAITAAPTAADAGTYLPIVDLRYEHHQASYNVSLSSCLYDIPMLTVV
jgi:hypothetical protein